MTVGLFGVALIALAAYGFVRLAIDLAENDDWVWLSALVIFVIGLAIRDVVRGRRSD